MIRPSYSVFCPLVAFVSTLPVTAAEPLRYQWQPDQHFAYEVEIIGDMPTKVETLKGNIAYQVKSSGDPLKVTYQGGLTKTTKNKPSQSSSSRGRFGFGPPIPFGPRGFGGGPFGPGGPFGRGSNPSRGLTQTTNQLTLTSEGYIRELEGTSQLPYLIGNLSLLVFEPLSDGDQESWTLDSGVAITNRSENSGRHGPPFFSPFGPFGPFGGREKPEETAPGSEVFSFSRKSTNGDLVIYEKTYRLHAPGDERSFTIEGKGTWTFNRRLGVSESLDFSHRVIVAESNTTITIPVSIKYRRMSAEEWDGIVKKREEADQRRREEAQRVAQEKKAKAEAPIEGDERKKVLADLRSKNLVTLAQTLKMLAGKTARPDEELAGAIGPLVHHRDKSVSQQAEDALAKFSPDFKRVYDLNRAYQGRRPIEPTGPPVLDATPLPAGLIVAARKHGQWYPAKVMGTLDTGQVLVKINQSPWDDTCHRADLRLAPPEVQQPNVDPSLLTPAAPAAAPAPARGQAFRTWADDSGTFSVEAKYLGTDGENVRLEKKDGREIKVPMARLSQPDRQFVEELQKNRPSNPFD